MWVNDLDLVSIYASAGHTGRMCDGMEENCNG